MLIAGLQKMTLLDYPGHVACTVFTGGCNLRCPFCHNSSLVLPDRIHCGLGEEEVLAFLEKRRGLLEGVAVTGGEPLLQAELPAFLRRVRALGYGVKLDTNGTFPRRLEALLGQGLVDYVAMDVKGVPGRCADAVGIPGFDSAPMEESIRLLLGGGTDYEFRTTVVRGLHTPEGLVAIARRLRGAKAYYLQQYRPSDRVLSPRGLAPFSPEEMGALLARVREVLPTAAVRGVD